MNIQCQCAVFYFPYVTLQSPARPIQEYMPRASGRYEVYAIDDEHDDEDRLGEDGVTNHEQQGPAEEGQVAGKSSWQSYSNGRSSSTELAASAAVQACRRRL